MCITWYKNKVPILQLNNKRTITNDDITVNRLDAGPADLISKGQEWFFSVKPSDGKLFGPTIVSHSIFVANTPPIINNITLSSSNVDPTIFSSVDNITVSQQYSDINGDPAVSINYRWLANGIEVKNGSSNTLKFTEVDSSGKKILRQGTVIQVEIKAFDGTDFSIHVLSNSVTIIASKPVVVNVSIVPSIPTSADTLKLSYQFTDFDGLSDQSKIFWYRNNSQISIFNNAVQIPSINISSGQQWFAIVTPSNGVVDGIPVKSNTVLIQF